jgi:ABC-type antimicrobial peptide transport system permease subunit
MQTRDLIRVCLQNLKRRKSRTFLTVLGVLIGCCSIVIMVSIGIGMKESQQILLEQMGDLTIITVYPPSNSASRKKLDKKAMEKIRKTPGVVSATPKLSAGDVSIKVFAGKDKRYVASYATVSGMDKDALDKMGFELLNGEPLDGGQTSVLIGQYFAYGFADTKRPEGSNTVDLYSMYNDDGTIGKVPDAYFDPFKTPVTLELTAGNGEKAKAVSVQLNVRGRMKENYSKGSETSDGIILDTSVFEALLARAYKESGMANNSRRSFASALVKVREIGKVESVEKAIRRMGFQTNSMESIRKPMEEEARQKQLMLGGLGAVSLFVAALGITNTMIMSISERTREIGIMKSLGCYVKDIRTMFLMEAGAIGLLGGLIGSVVSLLISVIMNAALSKTPIGSAADLLAVLTTPGSRMSVIPPWLLAFAVIFSIMIGLGSGYYPANKAVRIPALEAIKES